MIDYVMNLPDYLYFPLVAVAAFLLTLGPLMIIGLAWFAVIHIAHRLANRSELHHD